MTTDDLGRIAFTAFWSTWPEGSTVEWHKLTREAKEPWIRAALAIRDLEQKGIS